MHLIYYTASKHFFPVTEAKISKISGKNVAFFDIVSAAFTLSGEKLF